MKKKIKSRVWLWILVAVLSCFILIWLVGKKDFLLKKRETDLEDYIAILTAMQIDWNAPKECIKAQTVIARGNFYLKWRMGEEKEKVRNATDYLKKERQNLFFSELFQVFLDSAKETRGQVLALENEVKQIPFHAVGVEQTRDGTEVLGEKFFYVIPVKTIQDKNSDSYVNGYYFELKELRRLIQKEYPGFKIESAKQIEVKKTDSQGYVLEIQMGNQEFQGEQVRKLLNLSSACFFVQSDDEMIQFLCRGIGHGLGLSQYTAKMLAKENKNYEEILKYFFPDLELITIEMKKNE